MKHFSARFSFSMMSAAIAVFAAVTPTRSSAQLTLIPDPELRTYLNSLVPGCVDGAGYLDPAFPGVQQIDVLILPVNAEDHTGIEQLGGVLHLQAGPCGTPGDTPTLVFPPNVQSIELRNFVAQDASTTLIPSFPASVTEIYIRDWWSQSELVLPALPPDLRRLRMYGGNYLNIATLPTLPSSLETIHIGPSYLSSVPELPAGLDSLTLFSFSLELDELNAGLKYLEFIGAPGHCLPILPDSLTNLSSNAECIQNHPVSLVAGNLGMEPIANAPLCNTLNLCSGSIIQGVDEAELNGMQLYPNPVTDELVVVTDVATPNTPLDVVDMTGRIVLRSFTSVPNTRVDVSSLKQGCYKVRVGTIRTARFVKR